MAELMRLAKYLKSFTDVQQFAYFLGNGGWEEVDNGRIG